MLLAEMGPNAIIDNSSDLGSREMDRSHDWINDARKRYSNTDLTEADTFVSRVSTDWQGNELVTETLDYQTLNEKQKLVFKRIESHYNDMLKDNQTEPLRIIVMGTAGTGKTYLINAIRGRLREMTGVKSKSPVIVLAPTGVTAFNINGITIHSALSIPIIANKNLDINGERLKQLQNRLQDVIYVIIDEKSMISRRMLGIIDMRLRQAFPENKNEPFGGRSIILFGDFGQLPPVLDLPMYTNNASHDESSNNGLVAYKQFKEVYELEQVLRQSGTKQQEFRDILLRLRDGDSSIDDWKILAKRFDENLNRIEHDRFRDAVFILT